MRRVLHYLASLITIMSVLFSFSSCTTDNTISGEGAVGDGKTLNTEIIQKAIDRVFENGGGTVIIPKGEFLTGSLIMKSGVTLELQKGAILIGSKNSADYHSIKPDFVALRTGQATKQLIFAEGQNDIAIIGEGTIDGQGDAFGRAEKGDEPGITRPHGIQFINCENVRIENVTMKNSGGWMQHYLACKNLRIKGIKVYNHCNYNNDGIDIDGCEDVIITECVIDSDDDAIVLKSTSPARCKNVIVSNCVIKSHCNSLKLGTESTGGFENIAFADCTISPSEDNDPIYGTLRGQSAISVEMVDGGALVGVVVDNITITETDCPIFIRLGNRARKYTSSAPDPGMGVLKNVIISNVYATTTSKISSQITAIPGEYAENIILSDIIINNLSTGTPEEAKIQLRENDQGYPTPTTFGEVIPASGFFVRHIKNISFNDVQIHLNAENHRPVFIFDDVKNAVISNPMFTTKENMVKLIVQKNSENIRLK